MICLISLTWKVWVLRHQLITTFYGRSNGFTDMTTAIAHGRYEYVDDGSMVQPRFLPRCAAERWGRRLTGTFMISTVSSVSKSWKRWNTNDMPWHDGHSKKGSCVIVSCPLKTAVFQRKVDIGHVRHGIFIKSLRARNIHSFDYVRGCMYVRCACMMWVCECTYAIACTWLWICGSLFMYGTCHFMHMWVCTPTRIRASDLEEERYVTSHTFSCTWFLRIEEFLILPCPTCPTCQPYILVGIVFDTFGDTVTCPVSKIKQCIRYDGWCAK